MYLHLHSTYLYNIRKSYYLILVSLSLSSFLATPRYDLLLRAVFDPRAAAWRVLAAVIIFLLFQIWPVAAAMGAGVKMSGTGDRLVSELEPRLIIQDLIWTRI